MATRFSFLGPFRSTLCFCLIALLLVTLSRIGLGVWQIERVTAVNGWSHLLLQGLRVDFATLCWLWGIAALGTAIFSGDHAIGRGWNKVLQLWLTLGLWLILFLEVSTPSFIEEYGIRPNRLYVEYLIYPKEVFSMLWGGRKLEVIFGFVVSVATLFGGWKLSGYLLKNLIYSRWYWRPVIALAVIVVTLLGARSSLGHRPLNPALVAFADDPLVNSLVINSSYSLVFAINQMGNEANAAKIYGRMDEQKVIDTIRKESGRASNHFLLEDAPSVSFNPASYQGKPKNLVIILQESLGARFVGGLGGLPLTPNIDALAQQGWSFERLYATGTRSVRGIEAITTGFTPTPARSVVKLGKSQQDFFTIAELLKAHGYETQFVYGGESHFDNMKSFFLGNGFSHIVDENNYDDPSFVASWGVSDEDLLRRAHQEFEQFHEQGKPFFSLVFSSSNHEPFEFPDDKVELYEQPKQTVNNAVKYADYAVGEFFKLAKASEYWKDTLFLIVADHDSRVGGASLVPISRFRIPGIILGDGVEPRQDQRVVSQIDMAPTLLSMMGVSDSYPMLGQDLTRVSDDWPGRALMQYDKNMAYMRGDDVVILQPERDAAGFKYDFATEKLSTAPQAEEMKQTALAWALWGSMAYNRGLYRSLSNEERLAVNHPQSDTLQLALEDGALVPSAAVNEVLQD
ncbi:LTA synthase family protein [Shewanella eurypsychrophilus]|uniref:LTA synthase family protein n=1 Tax=Shewanella eurypsychrophilus TaxID=2593656 RepID=A0ABX6V2V4_9GAMM|nr:MULTISPECIES: LTA synthase family protein [Shewanella]QFU20580.1 sulfatase-like hydrolase/transferase [Shewanella sp. YLB-09]QFU20861.1 sulfatase-like hydrolase/transferase [Shewanella sp. YLB-09]QPG56150.1 LTA synthase family protein [Shewanella eurypsychrophilus]